MTETPQTQRIEIDRANLQNLADADAFIGLLQHYASEPSGGGKALSDDICRRLLDKLHEWPGFVSFIARLDGVPIGLINCFTGFSTFRAKPLLNVHDVIVHSAYRGRGVARTLFAAAEAEARATGCCKMTLEVLTGNSVARGAYENFGFRPYVLDPAMGHAVFMEKHL